MKLFFCALLVSLFASVLSAKSYQIFSLGKLQQSLSSFSDHVVSSDSTISRINADGKLIWRFQIPSSLDGSISIKHIFDIETQIFVIFSELINHTKVLKIASIDSLSGYLLNEAVFFKDSTSNESVSYHYDHQDRLIALYVAGNLIELNVNSFSFSSQSISSINNLQFLSFINTGVTTREFISTNSFVSFEKTTNKIVESVSFKSDQGLPLASLHGTIQSWRYALHLEVDSDSNLSLGLYTSAPGSNSFSNFNLPLGLKQKEGHEFTFSLADQNTFVLKINSEHVIIIQAQLEDGDWKLIETLKKEATDNEILNIPKGSSQIISFSRSCSSKQSKFDLCLPSGLISDSDDIIFISKTLAPNSLLVAFKSGLILGINSANKVSWVKQEALSDIKHAFITSQPLDEPVESINLATDSLKDKKLIVASYSVDDNSLAASPVSWSKLFLQVHKVEIQGKNSLSHKVISYKLDVDPQYQEALVKSVKVSPISNVDSISAKRHVKKLAVAVDTLSHGTFLWLVDVTQSATQVGSQDTFSFSIIPTSQIMAFHGQLLSLLPLKLTVADHSNSHPTGINMLFSVPTSSNKPASAMIFTLSETKVSSHILPEYFHIINSTSGVVNIYKSGDAQSCPNLNIKGNILVTCTSAIQTSSLAFDPSYEKIASISYPSLSDSVHSRAAVLSDNNVLLKYLNPHMLAICTIVESSVQESEGTKGSKVFVSIIDTISGKLLQRIEHDGATGPVRSIFLENFVIVSYWNSIVKRGEVSVIGLYDGYIAKHDFSSLKILSSTPQIEMDSLANTYRSPDTPNIRSGYFEAIPLVIQKSYITNKRVMQLSHTISHYGITNKNVLMLFDSGDIHSVDLRQLHPRRPNSEPTAAEKEDGLMKYNPYLPLNPLESLNKNVSLVFSQNEFILSASCLLESQSVVFVLGDKSDIFVTTVSPSQGFDTLSEDFNYSTLVLLISLLAVVVFILRFFYLRNHLRKMWL